VDILYARALYFRKPFWPPRFHAAEPSPPVGYGKVQRLVTTDVTDALTHQSRLSVYLLALTIWNVTPLWNISIPIGKIDLRSWGYIFVGWSWQWPLRCALICSGVHFSRETKIESKRNLSRECCCITYSLHIIHLWSTSERPSELILIWKGLVETRARLNKSRVWNLYARGSPDCEYRENIIGPRVASILLSVTHFK
jgi:hypothetical protein